MSEEKITQSTKKDEDFFNPVKVDESGKIARRMIWSTKSIEAALQGIREGRQLIANPFYMGNTKLLKPDLNFKRTPEEIADFIRCKNDIIYFATKCKLMTPEGIEYITLRDYQEDYLRHLEKNQLSIFLSCRQSGKTTTSAIYMLHYIIFNYDKNALVLGNKAKTANEIMDKIKKIYVELPYYLKPGIYKWNESAIVLDNGSRIMSEATTENSGIGFTLHCVLADEFAHVPPNIMEKFYNNLFPTITAGKAKFIISSTQNGYNLFQRLYSMAEMGENDYAPFKVDWWQVPEWNPDTHQWEKRDEAWHKRQVANYGSEEAFNQQFGTMFDINSNTLIAGKVLKSMTERSVDFVNKDFICENSDCFFWHPDYEPSTQLKNDWIVITIDISEGNDGDYTVFTIGRLVENGTEEPDVETIGYFRSNTIEVSKAVRILKEFVSRYCPLDRILVSLERNMYGDLFMKYLMEYIEKDGDTDVFDESIIVKTLNSHNKWQWGIQMNSKTKLIGCKTFKEKYEKEKIKNLDHRFIVELQNFGDAKGNGTYKAVVGHDDMVMSQMQLSLVQDTNMYKSFIGEFVFYKKYSVALRPTDEGPGMYDNIYAF